MSINKQIAEQDKEKITLTLTLSRPVYERLQAIFENLKPMKETVKAGGPQK